MVREVFPQLTEEQAQALEAGLPLPSVPAGAADDDSAPRISAGADTLPLVSCVLCVSAAKRVKLARQAAAQFFDQIYPRKQLVIINGSGEQVFSAARPSVKEVAVAGDLGLAAMRDRGVAESDGEWVKPCWDDDDYYHPGLLWYVLAHRLPGQALLLACQLRVHLRRGSAYLLHQGEGIPNTMVVPRDPSLLFEAGPREDVAYWMEHWGVRTRVIYNGAHPASVLSVAAYHGANTLSEGEFFSRRVAEGRLELEEDSVRYLTRVVLPSLGYSAALVPPAVVAG